MVVMPTVYPVTAHTDHVGPGTTFVAIAGFARNGADYIISAINQGATTIVVGHHASLTAATCAAIDAHHVTLMRVANTRDALAHLSAQASGNAHTQLKLFAITGTKGKTTTTFLLEHMLKSAGYITARTSSVKNSIAGSELPAPFTTPHADYLHQFFKLCVDNNVTHVVMEVAAQAISTARIAGLTFDGVLFTNIAREHLEFYSSLDDYFATKAQLATMVKPDGFIGINADDQRISTIASSIAPLYYFSISAPSAHVRGTLQTDIPLTAQLDDTRQGTSCSMTSNTLCGTHNLYNVLAAATGAVAVGIPLTTIVDSVATFEGVPGRFERYLLPNRATVIIDGAHNPSSFEAMLSMLRPYSAHIIVVFGASGDRDAGRRPDMGRIAATYADQLVLTSDNPRSENVVTIVEHILAGISPAAQHAVTVKYDRRDAILYAYSISRADSLIVLLGMGAGEYEQIGTTKVPLSERAIIHQLQQNVR